MPFIKGCFFYKVVLVLQITFQFLLIYLALDPPTYNLSIIYLSSMFMDRWSQLSKES